MDSLYSNRNNNMQSVPLALVVVVVLLLAPCIPAQTLVDYSKPASHFPYFVGPYLAHQVPPPSFGNTPLVDGMLEDGRLGRSRREAVACAVGNNLHRASDCFIHAIADTD